MTFRPIDTRGFGDIVVPRPEPRPQLVWVRITDLVIDERYQRPLENRNRAAIRAIAEAFSWARFSPIAVAPAGNSRYAVIDGQHRAHAAALCGFAEVPAMIVQAETKQQAEAFVAINTKQIAVNRHQVFKAALASGDLLALRMRDNVRAAGCELMTYNASSATKKAGQVYALETIRVLSETGGDYAIRKGLAALLRFDPTAAQNFDRALIDPLLHAVAQDKAFNDEELIYTMLRQNKPWIVLERAAMLAETEKQPRIGVARKAFVALLHKTRRETGKA